METVYKNPVINNIVEKLREKRNDLIKQSNEIQKQIDEVILKEYQFDKYRDQYVYIQLGYESVYMHINGVYRLYRGARLCGKTFSEYLFATKTDWNFSTYREITMHNDETHKIKIISKEEYYKRLDDYINKIRLYERDSSTT